MNKLIIIGCILTILISCNHSNNLNEKAIALELDKLEIEYEKVCKNAGMEVWEYYSDTSINSMTKNKELFSNFLLDDSKIDNINYWNSKTNEILNDTLIRRLELWKSIVTCAHVDFSTEIIELQNTLETQLSKYPSDEISTDELEASILRLINLRNNKARQLGYGNYAYMVLQNTGIDTIWFENLIRTIDSASIKPYNTFIQNHFPNTSNIEYDDLRKYIIEVYRVNENPVIDNNEKEQLANLINTTLLGIGIKIEDLPIQFEITNLPPGIGGFGNCIDIPNDFRAVAMEELGFYYLLHEIGHGLHWTNVSIEYPILKGYEWCTGNLNDSYCESMAEVIAKFSQNKSWMKENGFTDSYIDSIQNNRKVIYPVYLRLKLINTLFEIELYKNQNKSPDKIKSELYSKYLLVDKDFSTKPNLIRLSYVSYPVYEQNYLIADIISWQIHEYLKKEYGGDYSVNSNVGHYLKEKLWKDGELYNWQNRVEGATDKELDIEGYLKHLME